MSMSLHDRSTGIVPCIDSSFLGLEELNLGLENGRDESNSGFLVNPSSNSIRSATTDRSQDSWRSSSSASTSATSFASAVSKAISTVWCVINTPVGSRAARTRSKQRLSVDTVDLESGLWLPLRPLKEDSIELASDQRSFFERKKEVTSHVTNRIQMIFDFGKETYSYGLDYNVFRWWKYMASLLSSLSADGTICVEVWDEIDRIQVTSEDWEARAYCEDIRDEDVSDRNEEEELHDDEGSHGDDWWFKRWKTRVEKRKEGWEMNRKPWLVGAIAMVAIGISFCTVAWLSS